MSSQSVNITDFRTLPGVISETKQWFVFPTIFGVSEISKKTYWTIMVGIYDKNRGATISLNSEHFDNRSLDDNLQGIIRVESGYVGSVPKSSTDTRITSGKNIGKANETNVFSQALKEAYSKYRVQLDKTKETEYVRPMLATDYNKLKKPVKWPLWIQCKFDGNRAMTHIEEDNTVLFYSRQLKPIPAISYNIEKDIVKLYQAAGRYLVNEGHKKIIRRQLFFDGEIYKHNTHLQEHGIFRRKEKLRDDETEGYKYYIYDLCLLSSPDMTYDHRKIMLEAIFKIYKEINSCTDDSSNLVLVKTILAKDIEAAEAIKDAYLDENYEGAILRVPDAPYKQSALGYHSKVLLKLKPRMDAEYLVVGISGGESKGKEEDALMVICVTDAGENFTVQPALPLATRISLFIKYTNNINILKKELLGRHIKVYYDALSKSGKPLRAKTKLEIRKDL